MLFFRLNNCKLKALQLMNGGITHSICLAFFKIFINLLTVKVHVVFSYGYNKSLIFSHSLVVHSSGIACKGDTHLFIFISIVALSRALSVLIKKYLNINEKFNHKYEIYVKNRDCNVWCLRIYIENQLLDSFT